MYLVVPVVDDKRSVETCSARSPIRLVLEVGSKESAVEVSERTTSSIRHFNGVTGELRTAYLSLRVDIDNESLSWKLRKSTQFSQQ